MSESLQVTTPAEHVRLLTLHRPERRNALDLATIEALVTTLRELDADDDVRAIVLTGSDPAFSAGLDLAEVGSGVIDLEAIGERGDDPWVVLQQVATPTIAAVNGAAVTGGLELVLDCDLAIASDAARFADTHGRVGIHPSGGLTVLLPRFVGRRAALGMSLTGRFVDAEEALTMGLVNAVVAHDQLLDAAVATAVAITEADQRILAAILATYRAVDGLQLDEALVTERERAFEVRVDADAVEARRAAIIARGSGLTKG
ncbi:enoyl-CoA hydratase [Nitriliruptor alkaliphilus]|uniref:enoyl-CoA hydratase n=1 Tax=Nitriliruptor alkaliphilus TaxID=427918 RepID=UPI000697619E|nr:enoyl-CoA hydratase [Nitriliruptor alkaliphilus]